MPQFMLVGRDIPAAFAGEITDHWKQTAGAHPQDAAVLRNAAGALSTDRSLGLALLVKAVKLDPGCGFPDKTMCRGQLGGMYAGMIVGLVPGFDVSTCAPKTPDEEHAAASAREALESSSDPIVLYSAGVGMKAYSSFYGRCGGNADEAIRFGMQLINKATTLMNGMTEEQVIRKLGPPQSRSAELEEKCLSYESVAVIPRKGRVAELNSDFRCVL